MNVSRTPYREHPREIASVTPVRSVSRSPSATSITELLSRSSSAPAALVVSGEAGIGKTTLWLAGVAQARECGFEVLSARPVSGESALAYASVADLLSRVDSTLWSSLPDPQRQAVERILLQDNDHGAGAGRRAAATALQSVVHRLAETTPVLLAIDDLQWLDSASADAFSFVTRRLCGRVGVLATIRTCAESPSAIAALEMPSVSDIRRTTLAPLTLGALHTVLFERLGHSLSRPALVRIHDVSGGNPFYALELAFAMTGSIASGDTTLPGTLTDVVRTRVGTLTADVQQALLAAASVEAPTVEMVAHALNTSPTNVIRLLENAEDAGIVRIDGHRLRFAHPLLARGVYSGASPASRRRMHRTVAEIVVEPESRARHLALAAASDDPRIVRLLDAAAESARLRGAQAKAAELLDLAVGLGGDTPNRRIRSASCHFAAGDVRHARGLLELSISRLEPGAQRARTLSMLAGVSLFDDGFDAASELLRQGLAESAESCAARVTMLIAQAFTRMNTGDADAAMCSAETAFDEAGRLGDAALLSQALGMRLVLAMLRGDGLDEPGMRRVLGLEDSQADTAMLLRSNHALMLAWSGQLDRAHTEIEVLSRRCLERGYEHEQLYLGFHSAWIEIWRSNFPAAATITKEATERAQQLGGDLPLAMVATMQASLDTYAGRVHEARQAGRAALQVARRCGAHTLSRSAITTLAFLESSLGDHGAVAKLLEPLLKADADLPRATEIVTAAYVPDAVEALINLGRLDEADSLVGRLQGNGARLDRAWMLAVGGRCRAMLLAARGQLEAACRAAQQAMAEHDGLPMPFERARTQLLLGQIQRRQRRKDAACVSLSAALQTFEDLGTPLWAQRARDEMARTNIGPRTAAVLTPSEQRVAELATSGMTNREVATALFISPKTVEANLARIYRKLGIHSRAELGRCMGQPDG